jgi:putative sigma-54 modulation protein
MNVEYTGRQYEVTPAIRQEIETGLTKIKKILGDKFETKVILAVEKHRHKAEITISPRNGPLVGIAQASDMTAAVNEALDHLEKQAVKYKTRWRSKKRQPRKGWDGKGWDDRLLSVSATNWRFPSSCTSFLKSRKQPRRTWSGPVIRWLCVRSLSRKRSRKRSSGIATCSYFAIRKARSWFCTARAMERWS